MKATPQTLWKLFCSTFMLSAFTVGGGYVIVPLMRKKFVEELGWIEQEEMLDLVAIGQSSPGPIAVNTSILVGYRIGGIVGAFISMFGTVLPPLIIITVISFFYEAFKSSKAVAAVLWAMRAGVAAVILDVVIRMGYDVIKKKKILPICIMFGAFIAAAVLKINVVLVILACGVIGAVSYTLNLKKEGEVQ